MEHMEHMEHMGWIMLDSAVFVHFNPLENVMDYPLAKPQNLLLLLRLLVYMEVS